MTKKARQSLLGLTRLGFGWIFFWAFIDKLLGLGFTTTPEQAWIAGGSPTMGFLKFATHGPLAEYYQSIAGHPAIDWLFMMALLGLGLAYILGIGVRIASYGGVLLMALMYSAALPPEHNPILDEHVMYALTFIILSTANAGNYYGLGKEWSELPFVKKYPNLM